MGFCGPGLQTAIQPTGTEITREDLKGPIENRSCRDVAFLFIFLFFLSGMVYIAYSSFILGDPNRLIFGVDSWGNVCGKQNSKIDGVSKSGRDTSKESNLFYFDQTVYTKFSQGLLADVNTVSICVSLCPNVDINNDDELRNFSTNTNSNLCIYEFPVSNYSGGSNDALGDCPPLPITKQESILFRCVPQSISNNFEVIASAVNNLLNVIDSNFMEKCIKDLQITWKEVCYLSAIGLGVSFILVVLLRFISGIIIWSMVILLSVGSIVGTALCWFHYYSVKTNERNEQTVTSWLIGSICVTVITVIIVLILLALRKHISLVVQLFDEAGRAISNMPLLLIQPIWTVFVIICTLVAFIYIFLCIESSGHPTIHKDTGFVKYQNDPTLKQGVLNVIEYQLQFDLSLKTCKKILESLLDDVRQCNSIKKYLKWYHVIGSIWIIQFINACEKISIAGAVAEWYFTRYHLGSAALGSLILTVVIVIRLLLSVIHGRLKNRSGPIIDFLLKCTRCCLWCFEKFIQFLNSNAYIEIAILGSGFCKAARQAFHIIVNNALRIAAINSVGDFTLFLGKMASVAVVAIAGMEIMAIRSDVYYVWLPITLSCIVTYIIASCFFGVYELCIDTIFMCFCEDCERNNGQDKPYHMGVGLMKYIQYNNTSSSPVVVCTEKK